MAKVFANSGDTAASDLCLHCLPITLFGSPDKNVQPASVAQLDAPSDWRPGGRGFNPR